MAFDFSPLIRSALQSPLVENALQFIDYWNGPLRDDETVADNPGSLFLLQFFKNWGSIEPTNLQQKLPFMSEYESAFATALLILEDDFSQEEFEQLLVADYPWIRWTAALLSQQKQREEVFSTLLFMLGEFVEDERVIGTGNDWGFFIGLLPYVTLELEAFDRQDVVIPKARETLALSVKYTNAQSTTLQDKKYAEIKRSQTIYQTQLLFLLGRYKAWGAIVGLNVPTEVLIQWMVLISLGALYRDYPPTSSLMFYWEDYPELKQAVRERLTCLYGLKKQEVEKVLDTDQSDFLEYYGCWPRRGLLTTN